MSEGCFFDDFVNAGGKDQPEILLKSVIEYNGPRVGSTSG